MGSFIVLLRFIGLFSVIPKRLMDCGMCVWFGNHFFSARIVQLDWGGFEVLNYRKWLDMKLRIN